jgi:hypothetical protein
MDLGLAVSDYNSHDTEVFDEIIKLSLAYVSKVKQAVMEGQIRENDIADYFALLGASWASIQPRVQNEYSVTAAHTPMADPHTVVAAAAAAAAASAASKAGSAAKSVTFAASGSPASGTPASASAAAEVPVATTPAEIAALAKVTDALKKVASK